MKLYNIRYLFVFFIFSISFNKLNAQIDKASYYDIGKQFYYNYFYLPTDGGDSIEIFTIYKIAYNLLKFNKIIKPGQMDRFEAIPQFEVEFKDTEGIIRNRDSKRDTIILDDPQFINSKTIYYYGSVISKLSSKVYTPHVYLWDGDIVKLAEKELQKLDLSHFNTKLELSSPLICRKSKNNNQENYSPYILDRNASFSSNDIDFIFLTTIKTDNPTYNYSIEFLDMNRNNFRWGNENRIYGQSEIMMDYSIEFIHNKGDLHTFNIVDKSPRERGYTGIVRLTFTADVAVPGDYRLRVWNDLNPDTLIFNFSVVWENMPLSLRTPAYAAELMYYVLTDEEYEELYSGSDRDILRNIFDWWKNQDPTRFTMYNEAMNEYFNRADYAFFNFKNLYQKDGAKTDRGKVHILNGLPTLIDTKMNSSGVAVEIWHYETLRKIFFFETDKSGIVFLREIKDV